MNAPQDKTEDFSYLDDRSLEVRFDTCTSVEELTRVLFAIVRGNLRKYRHPPMKVWVLPATEEESDLSWPKLGEETDLVVTDMGLLPNGHWPPIKVGGRNRETVWDDPKLRMKAYGLAYMTALRLTHENPRLSLIPDQDVSSRHGVLSLLKWCLQNKQPNGSGQAGGTAKKVAKGGRKPLSAREANKRQSLINRWTQARGSGIDKYDFCQDAGIEIAYLDRCLDWNRHKRECHQ